nr:sulfotransferase [uncultured Carboxylicivirga sp.]
MLKLEQLLIRILLKVSKNKHIEFTTNENLPIVFMLGMFRSGTSLTCRILEKIGFNLSPKWRLLHAKGSLKNLNPDGFYEDFLFAQLSRYWYALIEKSGDNPPSCEDVKSFDLKKIPLYSFILFSEKYAKEERISFFNRLRSYLFLFLKGEKAFFTFKKKALIKVPMLTPFYEQLNKWFPEASFITIIRNPSSTIKSSKALTEKSSLNLYDIYYQHLSKLNLHFKEKNTIISYDNLINDPEESVKRFCKHFNLTNNKSAEKLINMKLIRNIPEESIDNELYKKLLKEAIN